MDKLRFLAIYIPVCLAAIGLSYGIMMFFEWLKTANDRISRLDGKRED